MAEINILDFDNKGFTQVLKTDDFEYVDPIKKTKEMSVENTISLERKILLLNKPPYPIEFFDEFLNKRALDVWNELYKEIIETRFSENLVKLLISNSKKEQTRLLKGQSITIFQLTAFIFTAYKEYGFKLSQYRTDHNHNGLDEDDLPFLIHSDRDKVTYLGSTNLSEVQLKQVIKHRKVIIAKFLDNGVNWHCFFVTYKSLRGEENWKEGQPHYHYISDKFGLKRSEVLKQLKSRTYSFSSLPHIDFLSED